MEDVNRTKTLVVRNQTITGDLMGEEMRVVFESRPAGGNGLTLSIFWVDHTYKYSRRQGIHRPWTAAVKVGDHHTYSPRGWYPYVFERYSGVRFELVCAEGGTSPRYPTTSWRTVTVAPGGRGIYLRHIRSIRPELE